MVNLPQPVFINGNRNSRIAVYRYAHPSSRFPPVILTHGTFSNALICAELAGFLTENGYECWVYEWAGHGHSEYGTLYPDAEDFALHDVPLVVETVLARTKKKSCIWAAHSGGGFLPFIYMARHLDHSHKIEKIVGLGSQTSGAGKSWIGKVSTRIIPFIIEIFGKVPGPLFGLGPEDEASAFLTQWSQWNRTGRWVGKDGFDYYDAMKKIRVPVMLISGGKDFIAPPHGCRKLSQSLGSIEKKFIVCSKANGFLEDYNHPRLIASKNSKKEIWPVVLEFIGC